LIQLLTDVAPIENAAEGDKQLFLL